ncbi:MAG: sigma-54 dependent transcriptional regulator [bacterium]
MKPNILLIDDDKGIRFSFVKYLESVGYNIDSSKNLKEAKEKLSEKDFDVALLDIKLPDGNGLELVSELREKHPSISIVVITGHGNISLAVEAMKMGADNFLTKPVNMNNLNIYLQKSLEIMNLRMRQRIQQRLKIKSEPFFGTNPVMTRIKKLAEIACKNDSSILLIGETGTGKEVMAKWIHNNSLRKDTSFVEVNCAGLKEELLASELFGHVRGAFTTALQDKVGLIEAANGGTIYLDEIASMNLNIQAQLLKVIEEKQFRRLGETKIRKSDFRLICSTNKDLLEEVQKEKFRNDLYYRINVFPIELPPLREIKDNLPKLIMHLLCELKFTYPDVSPEVMNILNTYEWPGNIREVKNVLERALILAEGRQLSVNHFPGLNSASINPVLSLRKLDDFEKEYVLHVVNHFCNDTKKAADALGVSRASLYRKLSKIKKK